MHRLRVKGIPTLLSVVGELGVVIVTQLVALTTLSVAEYARYSAVYLLFGLAYGLSLAVVCDVWARQRRRASFRVSGQTESVDGSVQFANSSNSDGYGGALASCAVLAGLINGTFALTLFSPMQSIFVALATVLGLCRSGNRYFLIATNRAAKAGASDVVGAIGGTAVWVGTVHSEGSHLTGAVVAWMVTSSISLFLSNVVFRRLRGGLIGWIRENYTEIRALIGDALLLNVSSAANPYLAAAVAGPVAMAIVRGATSVLYPLRLLLGAIRPKLVSTTVSNWRIIVPIILGLGAALGVCIAAALWLVSVNNLLPGSTLELLGAHYLSIGVLAWASAVSLFFQFEAKGRLSRRALIGRRAVHTVVMIVSTLVCLLVGGANAAVVGLTIGTVVTIVLWIPRQGNSRLEIVHKRGE